MLGGLSCNVVQGWQTTILGIVLSPDSHPLMLTIVSGFAYGQLIISCANAFPSRQLIYNDFKRPHQIWSVMNRERKLSTSVKRSFDLSNQTNCILSVCS